MSYYVVMKILSWNVRGLGRAETLSRVKELLRLKRVDMVLLQETKHSSIGANDVRSLWPSDSVEFMAVDMIGTAGGFLCI